MTLDSKGLSLIELAIVLCVMAIVVSLLTPLVYTHIDNSRDSRATADLRTLADAIRLYRDDVGEYPIFSDLADANSDTAAATLFTTRVGSSPSGTGWTTGIGTTEVERFLNGNFLNRPTATVGGRIIFRGPYVGNIDSDPWGNKYYLTASNLEDDSAYFAFVISAGPNGVFDTTKDQPRTGTLSVGGDDIVMQVR